MRQIRVLVVDDHALFRRGLVSLLMEMPGIQLTGGGRKWSGGLAGGEIET